ADENSEQDQDKSIGRIDDPAGEFDRPAQLDWRRHLEIVAAPHLERDVADNEGDPDSEKNLREMIFPGTANEVTIDQIPDRNDRQAAPEHAKREASSVPCDRQANVATEQIVGAVGHVHDAHQAEAEREPASEQEQEGGEGNTVDRLEDAAVHEKSLYERVRGAAQPATQWAKRTPQRRLALVRTPLEKFLRLPRPELRDILVGLERDVGQHLANHRMFDLLN